MDTLSRMETEVNESTETTEAARIEAVHHYEILDTPPDGAFDRITELASRLFNVPISIVSIVDIDRIWFKSHHGIEAAEIPRDPGLCSSAILADDIYVVEDALKDARTLANPLVTGALGLRFYAAQPLATSDGFKLGTLCIIDREQRTLSEDERATLAALAATVMDSLELRLSAMKVIRMEVEKRESLIAAADQLRDIAGKLEQGLESNREIGKALGLIMAHYKLDDQSAFEMLKGHSQNLNTKLRQIASDMVAHHNQGHAIPTDMTPGAT